MMMDACSATSDNVTQEGFTFLIISVQKATADVQMVMPLLFDE
jgi:hypothetical protein